jgi:5-methylcytosine-specific restriction endonuclease McrA
VDGRKKGGAYIRAAVLSCPEWQDRAELYALKAEAARITLETGVAHVLDHIVPLNHSLVCGLTVPWNLQIITKFENDQKGNKYWPDMPYEQLELSVAATDETPQTSVASLPPLR